MIFDAVRWSYRGPLDGIREEKAGVLPATLSLSNFPNPFNPVTRLRITLPGGAMARIEVTNLIGQRVAVLLDGWLEGGIHDVPWDATGLSSGMYLVRLRTLGEGSNSPSLVTRTVMLTR
jgi:hypothetical protein